MPYYPGDFKADTADLTLAEKGAYHDLIDYLWVNGGTVKNDTNRLLAASGLAADWSISGPKKKQILAKILSYFDQKAGQISHGKITALSDKAKEISKLRAEAGRKGGQASPSKCFHPNHTIPNKENKSRENTPHKKRASQLPADWKLPDDYREYCITKRPDLDPDATAENFLDYYLSHGKPMADWKRTWQRWVRNEHGNQQNRTGSASLQTPQSRNKAALERKRRRDSGEALVTDDGLVW